VSSSSLSPSPLASPELGGRSRGPRSASGLPGGRHRMGPRSASDLPGGRTARTSSTASRGATCHPLHGTRGRHRPPRQAASAAPAGASPVAASCGRDSYAATTTAPDSKDLHQQSKALDKLTDHVEDLQLDSSQVQSICNPQNHPISLLIHSVLHIFE
jgi:hypothetical protein